jgi:uroporphyrin-III C-methyltransferase
MRSGPSRPPSRPPAIVPTPPRALAAAGVEFEVVPGVSSLAAVPAAAGIPITHRGVSDRVTLATGHAADDSEPDYESLVRAGGTIVLFMSLGRLERVTAGLIDAGLAPDTPAAVISRGTLSDQAEVIAPLAELAEAAEGLPAPALVVVGEVVSLAAAISQRTAHTSV